MNKGNLRDVVGSFPCLSLSVARCLGCQESMLSHLLLHLSTHGEREITKGKGVQRSTKEEQTATVLLDLTRLSA